MAHVMQRLLVVGLGLALAGCATEEGLLVTATAAPGVLPADATALELEWFVARNDGDLTALERRPQPGDRYELAGAAVTRGETLRLAQDVGDVAVAAVLRRDGEIVAFGHVEATFAAGELRAYALTLAPAMEDEYAARPADCIDTVEDGPARVYAWADDCLRWVDADGTTRGAMVWPDGDRDCDGVPMNTAGACAIDAAQCDPDAYPDGDPVDPDALTGNEVLGQGDGYTSGINGSLGLELDGLGCGSPCVDQATGEQVACDCDSMGLDDGEVHFGLPEVCDGVDNNCDGEFDTTLFVETACIGPDPGNMHCAAGAKGCAEATTHDGDIGCIQQADAVPESGDGLDACPEVECLSRESCEVFGGGGVPECAMAIGPINDLTCPSPIRLGPPTGAVDGAMCAATLWGYKSGGIVRATLGTFTTLGGFVPLGVDVSDVPCTQLALAATPSFNDTLEVLVEITPDGGSTIYIPRRLKPGQQVVTCELSLIAVCDGVL